MIKKKCRICGFVELKQILNYGDVNLSGNFFNKKKSLLDNKYNLKLCICKKCKHLQINNDISPKKLFNNYVWKTSDSLTNLKLIDSLILSLEKKILLEKKTRILEIASNDGSLLKKFNYKFNNYCFGVDPARNLKMKNTKKIKIIPDFFSYRLSKLINIKFDVVIARNVIAHLNNPNDVFKGVFNILDKNGIFIIEVPYLVYFFKKNQYDNVFHEHNGFHSIKSIIDLCRKNKLSLFDIDVIQSQGGSIRCYISKQVKLKTSKLKNYIKSEINIKLFYTSSWITFAKRVKEHRLEMLKLVNRLKQKNKTISIYGASGKGQVFLQFCNLNYNLISRAYDKNNDKIGKYTPGTYIQIYDPKNIEIDMPDYLLLTSWNIKSEIINQEKNYIKKGGRIIVLFPKPRILNL